MQDGGLLPATGGGGESGGNAKIVYILYLGGIVIGLLALIGVIVAYVSRNDSGGWVKRPLPVSRSGPSGSASSIWPPAAPPPSS